MRIIILMLFIYSISNAGNFTLMSDDITGQFTIKQEYQGFGCSGENKSPALKWSDAPKNTKSFAITMYDPDAPTGSGWWHWLAFNIPKTTTSIASNASDLKLLPKGTVEGTNDYGSIGFGGACPPKGDGDHRYIITVYALDVDSLKIDETTNQAVAGYMINAHTIKKSSIISYYAR
ncbi:YbhB/YbcL family Raf kinase inhibitor-like protein [Sulfurimonas sp. CS5]|jgi:Raf kinase inhibitor-like YbhB/YbcL family protein|uniref:YbhB/YbcL family Raf kinase inhibitor-like protein n=1 Tax=Sulfurimonas sp. CS5 TaxID=3391145 RepID=UPI0039EC1E5F